MKDLLNATACGLCPRKCGVNRKNGEIGYCGADHRLIVGRAALHHWEEPCISGTKGSGTVFFSHCSLKCIYCQNVHISRSGQGVEIRTERLAEIFLELESQGAHNVNLVTPTHFISEIRDGIRMAKLRGLQIPIVYNSSGYESVEALQTLKGLVDIYLTDVKYYSPELGMALSGAENYFTIAMEALGEMLNQVGEPEFSEDGIMMKGVIMRQLLIPGQVEDAKKVTTEAFQRHGNQIYYSLMSQYTPTGDLPSRLGGWKWENLYGQDLLRKVSREEYEEWVEYAVDLGVENGFVQEGEAASESFIPDFNGEGVKGIDK